MRDNICSCSNTPPESTSSLYFNITRSPTRIQVDQSQDGTYAFSDFEYILRNLRFVHDADRPPTDIAAYEASVTVSVSDGELTSDVAVSEIVVIVTNIPPMITLGNGTAAEIVMQDGVPVIPVLQVGADIVEDSDTISHITLTLTNPLHDNEQLYALSGESISPSITIANGSNTITLTGPASRLDFVEALNNVEIFYRYPPFESILQGEVPDFTPRSV